MALSGPPLEALLAKALALGIPVKDKIATMALSAPPLDGALLAKALALGIPLVFARLLISYLTSPLKQFPGPFLAKFTDLWRVLDYFRCTQMQSHQELHKKHGAAVRIGPNMISLSDPALLKTVYSTRGEFPKVCPMTLITHWNHGAVGHIQRLTLVSTERVLRGCRFDGKRTTDRKHLQHAQQCSTRTVHEAVLKVLQHAVNLEQGTPVR